MFRAFSVALRGPGRGRYWHAPGRVLEYRALGEVTATRPGVDPASGWRALPRVAKAVPTDRRSSNVPEPGAAIPLDVYQHPPLGGCRSRRLPGGLLLGEAGDEKDDEREGEEIHHDAFLAGFAFGLLVLAAGFLTGLALGFGSGLGLVR